MKNSMQPFGTRFGKIFLFASWMLMQQFILRAQADTAFTFLEAGAGLLSFKGDLARTKPSFSPSLAAGYRFNNWSAVAGFTHGKMAWNRQESLNTDNFKAEISAVDLRLNYLLELKTRGFPVQLNAGLGIGYSWFASYTDLKDAAGRKYIPWSDGSLRNLPEIAEYKFSAVKLTRDYHYETALATDQTSLYFPLSLGLTVPIDHRIRFGFTWELFLLQSDNLDRNTSNAHWDRLSRYSVKLSFNLGKKTGPEPEATRRPIPYQQGIDPEILLFSDEDLDGIKDLYDLCPGTPEGVAVNDRGCPPDRDQDGIADFLDKEPDSPTNTWVDVEGVVRTDAWIQNKYNDSLSWFTQPLRKIYRNCRPYPVKKFISPEQYETYARMLEENPSWRAVLPQVTRQIPVAFRKIDSNNDHIISLAELDFALNQIFDGSPDAISIEAFNEAIRYAFEIQN